MPTALAVGSILEVEIESLSYHGGRGVARHEGLVLFIPNTAPRERALVQVTAIKKNLAEAQLVELIRPSEHRRTPPCPVAGSCGGCAWQHVDYPTQVKAKEEILRHALRDFAPSFSFDGMLSAPLEFRYRNRIQLHVAEGKVGYFAKGSHRLVEIADCLIAEESLTPSIQTLKQENSPGRVELALAKTGEVKITKSGQHAPETHLFAQVNRQQNEQLIKTVLSYLPEQNTGPVLDLYCGEGNFTFPLAQFYPKAKITGVELSRAAVVRAQAEADRLGLSGRIQFQAQDVGKFLRERRSSVSLVVLDPPRPGLESPVVDELNRLGSGHLIYISCNPMTFARDAKKFASAGWLLNRLTGLDMFPQTEHIELVAQFTRI